MSRPLSPGSPVAEPSPGRPSVRIPVEPLFGPDFYALDPATGVPDYRYWRDIASLTQVLIQQKWPADCGWCVRVRITSEKTAMGFYIRSPWPSWLSVLRMFRVAMALHLDEDSWDSDRLAMGLLQLLRMEREEIEAELALVLLGDTLPDTDP